MDRVIPNFKLLAILAILSLLVLLSDTIQILRFPKTGLSYLTNPISFGLYQTSKNVGQQFYFIFAVRFAAQENKALKEQIGKLLSENASLRKNLAETGSLLSQEKHLDPATYKLVPARPIAIGRYLKIDQGLSVGLKLGQAVVSNDNYIGKIVQISEKSSSVQLTSDPDSKVSAFSQGLSGRAKGVLIGRFGSEMLLDKILHEEKIESGDLVYSEGLEGFLPRGLILGRVSQILEEESEIFKQAKILPNFDISDLELVFVIQE